jgi:hypothetical protein
MGTVPCRVEAHSGGSSAPGSARRLGLRSRTGWSGLASVPTLPIPPLGQPLGVGRAPEHRLGPVREPDVEPGGPPGASPMRRALERVHDPPEGAVGRSRPAGRGQEPRPPGWLGAPARPPDGGRVARHREGDRAGPHAAGVGAHAASTPDRSAAGRGGGTGLIDTPLSRPVRDRRTGASRPRAPRVRPDAGSGPRGAPARARRRARGGRGRRGGRSGADHPTASWRGTRRPAPRSGRARSCPRSRSRSGPWPTPLGEARAPPRARVLTPVAEGTDVPKIPDGIVIWTGWTWNALASSAAVLVYLAASRATFALKAAGCRFFEPAMRHLGMEQ